MERTARWWCALACTWMAVGCGGNEPTLVGGATGGTSTGGVDATGGDPTGTGGESPLPTGGAGPGGAGGASGAGAGGATGGSGGELQVGGAAGAAGTPASGGLSNGGASTGGSTTGGAVTGGTSTGGSSSGGATTGGDGGATGGTGGTECPLPGNSCTVFEGGDYVGERCGRVDVPGCGYAQCSGCRAGEYCSADNWCTRYDEGCEPLGAGLGVVLLVPVPTSERPNPATYDCSTLSCPSVPVEEDPATGLPLARCDLVSGITYWCREDLCPEWPVG